MYNITTTTWTMKRIVSEMKKNNINFRCAVQRGYVWDIGRQSLLIHSLLKGDIIPPLFIRRFANDSNQKMEARDGQQRCTTIFRFINGQFKLAKIPDFNEGDKFDFRIPRGEDGNLESINGLGWDDLTEDEKDKIKDATISIYYIDNATDEEADMIFFKLNNGKSLTNTELARVQAKSRDTIKELGTHEIFTKMFSESALINSSFDMVTKIWFMLNEDEPNLMSSHIKGELKSIDITPEDTSRIVNILNFISSVYDNISVAKIAKRILKKTHFLSLIPIIDRAIEDDIVPARFIEFIESFYDGKSTKEPTINVAYNENFDNASASRSRIRVRHNALMNHYEKMYNGEKEDIYSTNLSDFEEEELKEEEKGLNFDEVIAADDLLSESTKIDMAVEPEEVKTPVILEPKKENVKTKKRKTAMVTVATKDEVEIISTEEYNKELRVKAEAKNKSLLNSNESVELPF